MVTNPNFFSTSNDSDPLNQIKDAVDFPHSGLIKSLNGAMSDRFVISGCNITVGSSPHTAFTVATGVAIIEGRKQAITGATINLTNTQTNGFHLIVAPKPAGGPPLASTVAFRESTGSATNAIPDITAGDTIIAVVKYLGSGTAPEIQYLTADKKSSSLSVARENSGAYDQTLSIVGASGNTTLTSEENEVILKLNGTSASNLFKVTDSADQLQFAVKGDGTLTTDITASRALVTDASKNITASSVTSTELALLSGAAFGIGNNNILRANANLADNDFLRVDGTQIEGRTAAQTLTDIAAMPLAGGTFTGNVIVDTGQSLGCETFASRRLSTVSVSGSTTLTEATHAGKYLICSGNVTLPATSTAGVHFTILNTTGGNITVGRNGNNINGAGSDATVGTYNGVTCIAIGSNNWIALGV